MHIHRGRGVRLHHHRRRRRRLSALALFIVAIVFAATSGRFAPVAFACARADEAESLTGTVDRDCAHTDDHSRPPPPPSPPVDAPLVVWDAVHGRIVLPPKLARVVRLPEFQELRRVKQTGNVERVYSGAHHTRFAHSIGACHLGGVFMAIAEAGVARRRALERDDATPEDEPNRSYEHSLSGFDLYRHCTSRSDHRSIDDLDETVDSAWINATLAETVQLALLTHDWGHLAFSHLSDGGGGGGNGGADSWLRAAVESEYARGGPDARHMLTHEARSVALLRYAAHKYALPFTRVQIDLACAMIAGRPDGQHHGWAFRIVADHESGVDLDRIDYLLRDAHAVGVPEPPDLRSIVAMVADQRCASDTAEHKVRQMLEFRRHMYAAVYRHPLVRRADELTVAVLRQVAHEQAWVAALASPVHEWRFVAGDHALHMLASAEQCRPRSKRADAASDADDDGFTGRRSDAAPQTSSIRPPSSPLAPLAAYRALMSDDVWSQPAADTEHERRARLARYKSDLAEIQPSLCHLFGDCLS